MEHLYGFSEGLWELRVERGSEAEGRLFGEIDDPDGLRLIARCREGDFSIVEDADRPLEADDVLLVHGKEAALRELCRNWKGMTLTGRPKLEDRFSWSAFEVAELVVPPRSQVIGKTLNKVGLQDRAGLTALALWRGGRPLGNEALRTPLREGDGILLFGTRERAREFEPNPDFLWSRAPRKIEAPEHLRRLAVPATLIFLSVIAAAAFDLLPISVAALAGASGMVLLGILSPKEAYERIEWRTLVLIAGMYPVGAALQETGAAGVMADLISRTAGQMGPRAVLLAIGACSIVLTQFLHHAVVAVVMTPVALGVAHSLGGNPKAVAVAVIVGTSANFLLPVGHPAPLLVQDPGGYSNRDYLRYGIGLVCLVLGVLVLLVPWLWPWTSPGP